jgi:hypothetical protein
MLRAGDRGPHRAEFQLGLDNPLESYPPRSPNPHSASVQRQPLKLRARLFRHQARGLRAPGTGSRNAPGWHPCREAAQSLGPSRPGGTAPHHAGTAGSGFSGGCSSGGGSRGSSGVMAGRFGAGAVGSGWSGMIAGCLGAGAFGSGSSGRMAGCLGAGGGCSAVLRVSSGRTGAATGIGASSAFLGGGSAAAPALAPRGLQLSEPR